MSHKRNHWKGVTTCSCVVHCGLLSLGSSGYLRSRMCRVYSSLRQNTVLQFDLILPYSVDKEDSSLCEQAAVAVESGAVVCCVNNQLQPLKVFLDEPLKKNMQERMYNNHKWCTFYLFLYRFVCHQWIVWWIVPLRWLPPWLKVCPACFQLHLVSVQFLCIISPILYTKMKELVLEWNLADHQTLIIYSPIILVSCLLTCGLQLVICLWSVGQLSAIVL